MSLSSLGCLGLCLGLLAVPATAQPGSEFGLSFSPRTPATVAAVSLRIVYRDPANPDGKPPAVRSLRIELPAGASVNVDSLPACAADDQQIMAQGPSACPAESQVGTGTLTAITGFGAPVDPFLTDVAIFNTGGGWVEIVGDHATGETLAADRISVAGNVLTGAPPTIPGGPPDGQTSVQTIDFTFPASTGYFSTPPRCQGGSWSSTAVFGFADGSVQHASASTPCRTGETRPSGRCSHRIEGHSRGEMLRGSPRSDRIRGRGGDDRIRGLERPDCIAGGNGDDHIRGGGGGDTIRGGAGDDTIRVRGGGRDRVDCGRGHDVVLADNSDRLRRCEEIKRRP